MKNEELPEIEQPNTLEDCFRILKSIMIESELNMFRDYLEVNAITIAHHTIGRFLRNNWYLHWNEEAAASSKNQGYPQEKPAIVEWFNNDYDIVYGDDMSTIVLAAFHRMLNKKPVVVISLVKKYKTRDNEEKI